LLKCLRSRGSVPCSTSGRGELQIKIAQGCDREEAEDRLSFLRLARDSAIEVEYYLLLCYELELLSATDYDRLVSGVVEVKELLESFIQNFYRNF